jgi:hypothetical protein
LPSVWWYGAGATDPLILLFTFDTLQAMQSFILGSTALSYWQVPLLAASVSWLRG